MVWPSFIWSPHFLFWLHWYCCFSLTQSTLSVSSKASFRKNTVVWPLGCRRLKRGKEMSQIATGDNGGYVSVFLKGTYCSLREKCSHVQEERTSWVLKERALQHHVLLTPIIKPLNSSRERAVPYQCFTHHTQEVLGLKIWIEIHSLTLVRPQYYRVLDSTVTSSLFILFWRRKKSRWSQWFFSKECFSINRLKEDILWRLRQRELTTIYKRSFLHAKVESAIKFTVQVSKPSAHVLFLNRWQLSVPLLERLSKLCASHLQHAENTAQWDVLWR